MDNELFLVYVNPIGKDSSGIYEYEFFFSKTPEKVWGEDWAEECPSACENLLPDPNTYDTIKRLKTNIPFTCAQEQSCFSLQDCIDGCVSISYENISEYSEYPSPYRIVFAFGEDYKSVEEKLASRHQIFSDILNDF